MMRDRVLAIGYWSMALLVTGGASLVVIAGPGTFNAALGAVMVAAVTLHVLLLPTAWLPSMALLVHVLVPAPPIPLLLSSFTPSLAVLILLAWTVRRLVERTSELGGVRLDWRHLAAPSIFMVWLVLSTLFSPALVPSAGWVFAVFTGLVLFAMVPVTSRESGLLLATWVVAGCILAVHVLLESVAQDDLLYGWFYDQLGVDSVQHWSTYRPEASFRHPLSAALFLSVGAMIAAGEAVRRGRGIFWFGSGLCATAAVLTLSRGALVSMVVGFVVLWALWSPQRFRTFPWLRHTLGALGTLVLLCIMNVGPLADRLASAEAGRSTETRLEVMDLAWSTALAQGLFGAGPDRSQIASAPFNPAGIPIESSLLQLLVSLGFGGLLLFLLLMGTVLAKSICRRTLGATVGLATFLSSITFFNVMEQKESLIVLGGLLVLAACAPRGPSDGPGSSLGASLGSHPVRVRASAGDKT